MKGPGFPDPLFETLEELEDIAEENWDVGSKSLMPYLLLQEINIGALRSADPFLGDLTVMAREAIAKVGARIEELRNPDGSGVPLGQA